MCQLKIGDKVKTNREDIASVWKNKIGVIVDYFNLPPYKYVARFPLQFDNPALDTTCDLVFQDDELDKVN